MERFGSKPYGKTREGLILGDSLTLSGKSPIRQAKVFAFGKMGNLVKFRRCFTALQRMLSV